MTGIIEPLKKDATSDNLKLDYYTTHFTIDPTKKNWEMKYPISGIDSQTLELVSSTKILNVNLKTSGGISKDANGIYQTYQIDGIDAQSLTKASKNLSVNLKIVEVLVKMLMVYIKHIK